MNGILKTADVMRTELVFPTFPGNIFKDGLKAKTP
jgi:hypothetical protein